MKNLIVSSLSLLLLSSVLTFAGCTDIIPPNNGYGSGGYNDPYYGNRGSSYDNRYDHGRDYDRHEHYELDRERARTEEERRHLEYERDHNRPPPAQYHPGPPSPAHHEQASCPSGYRASEQKCTQEERKHGCKDVRLSNGLGCVHR